MHQSYLQQHLAAKKKANEGGAGENVTEAALDIGDAIRHWRLTMSPFPPPVHVTPAAGHAEHELSAALGGCARRMCGSGQTCGGQTCGGWRSAADGTSRGGWMCGGRICGGQICGGRLDGRFGAQEGQLQGQALARLAR